MNYKIYAKSPEYRNIFKSPKCFKIKKSKVKMRALLVLILVEQLTA